MPKLYIINGWLKRFNVFGIWFYRFDTGMVMGIFGFTLSRNEERYVEVDISRNEKGSSDFDTRVSKNSSIFWENFY